MVLPRLGFVALLASVAAATAAATNLTDFVNLYIGTDGGGWGISELPPGPQVPFGALRLGPDTSHGLEPLRVDFETNGGYFYKDAFLECFSHTHLVGAGGQDWQNFGVTVTRNLSDAVVTNGGYRSRFRHATEELKPGYYAVDLDDWGTRAEVTACGTHVGMHRYTCGAKNNTAADTRPCVLIVDLCHADMRMDDPTDFARACKNATIESVTASGPSSFTLKARMFNAGGMTYLSKFGGEQIYFHMELSASETSDVSFWENRTVHLGVHPTNGTTTTSQSLGVAFSAPAGAVFTLSTAISFLSQAHAEQNLHATLQPNGPGSVMLSFDACRASAVAQWESVLSQFTIADVETVAAARRDDLVVFYTAVYHAHMAPTIYTEASGEYLGWDGSVHTSPAGTVHVSDLSLWDTYRSHAPLMTFVQPSMVRDTVNSMIAMYTQSGNGTFPVWPMANVETGNMVGVHGIIIIADSVMKGVKGIETDVAFATVVNSVTFQTEVNLPQPYDYTPIELEHRSAAKTLDYAVDAGSARTFARWLNRSLVASSFDAAANAYKNVWYNKTEAFCARYTNGTCNCDYMYLPYPIHGMYVEGNGEQYRWYVPHDPHGLVALFPSPDEYAQQLSNFFEASTLWPFNTTLPNPFFWAGNEPTFLTPFQFAVAGNEYAWLTQKWVQELDEMYFFNGPAGVPGNDDYGAMASWMLFGHLGLYPFATSTNYTLFVPRFDNVTLSVGPDAVSTTPFPASVQAGVGGPVLRLVANNRPPAGARAYLANASLNGTPLPTPFVTHEQLVAASAAAGGPAVLTFDLVAEPTVFGAPAPSRGGPIPWTPQPLRDEAVVRAALRDVGERLRGAVPTARQRSSRFGGGSSQADTEAHRRRHNRRH